METSYKKIFAALDGGKTQDMVAQRAMKLASDNHAELIFGSVVDSLPENVTGTDLQALCEQVRRRISAMIDDTIKAIEADPNIPSFEFRVEAGPVDDTLHHVLIEGCNPDLVVCGERGFGAVKYAFVGSTSVYLIRHLRCDILVVKKND